MAVEGSTAPTTGDGGANERLNVDVAIEGDGHLTDSSSIADDQPQRGQHAGRGRGRKAKTYEGPRMVAITRSRSTSSVDSIADPKGKGRAANASHMDSIG